MFHIKIGAAIGFVCCLINLAHTSTQSGIKASGDGEDANIKLDVHPEITDSTRIVMMIIGNVGEYTSNQACRVSTDRDNQFLISITETSCWRFQMMTVMLV